MAAAIVGRDGELAALEDFLGARDGLPGVFVLEGEAGIGKTTLWRAGVEIARARSYRVLVTRPASAEAQMPLLGLVDLLGGCVGEVLDELPPPLRRAIEAALLLAEVEDTPPQPHTIATAVLSALRTLAQRAPVLLAVDDVQWLDPSSAAALEFSLRRVGDGLPLALVLGWRTDRAMQRPLGIDRLVDVRVQRIRVRPLSLGAMHRMIAARLGHALARPVLVRVHEVSGGNPFFALELAEAIERRGGLAPGGEVPLPSSLADALEERIHAVPADTQDALMAVACLRAATVDSLEAALGAQARSVLQPAIDARLLVVDGDSIHFAHPLTRSAVYADAWPIRRRHWHRRLAEVVTDPDERARHLALAMDAPDAGVAEVIEEAAHRARFRGAPEAAATLAEQAWRGTPPDDAGTAWRRGLLAVDYHMQSGDFDRFHALVDELLSLATSGDQRSQVYLLLSLVAHRLEGPAATLTLMDRALAEAESVYQRQSVESDYVSTATLVGDVEAGARHAREALRLADEIGNPATVADALALVAATEQVLGRGLRRDLLERADALAELHATDSMTETTGVLRNLYNWAAVLAAADEFAHARARLDAAGRLIDAQGLVQHLPELQRTRADVECWAGDWGLAAVCVDACEESADQTGQPSKREDVMYARAFVAAHRGDAGQAREVASTGMAQAEQSGNARGLLRHLAVLGFLELSLGDMAAAAAHLERAAEAAAASGFREPSRIRFHGDLAEALVALGRLDKAEELVGWLEQSGRTTGYPWTLATAARSRALVLAAGNELDAAVRTLDDALPAHERLGNPFERGRTLLLLGVVQRRAKRRAEARETLTEALAIFEELGAGLWADRARRELARIPGRRASDFETLTEAERRIAALVAEGRSNKEVAARLFVSVKTVEVTLTRVYRKLGIRSRAELAHHFAGAAKD